MFYSNASRACSQLWRVRSYSKSLRVCLTPAFASCHGGPLTGLRFPCSFAPGRCRRPAAGPHGAGDSQPAGPSKCPCSVHCSCPDIRHAVANPGTGAGRRRKFIPACGLLAALLCRVPGGPPLLSTPPRPRGVLGLSFVRRSGSRLLAAGGTAQPRERLCPGVCCVGVSSPFARGPAQPRRRPSSWRSPCRPSRCLAATESGPMASLVTSHSGIVAPREQHAALLSSCPRVGSSTGFCPDLQRPRRFRVLRCPGARWRHRHFFAPLMDGAFCRSCAPTHAHTCDSFRRVVTMSTRQLRMPGQRALAADWLILDSIVPTCHAAIRAWSAVRSTLYKYPFASLPMFTCSVGRWVSVHMRPNSRSESALRVAFNAPSQPFSCKHLSAQVSCRCQSRQSFSCLLLMQQFNSCTARSQRLVGWTLWHRAASPFCSPFPIHSTLSLTLCCQPPALMTFLIFLAINDLFETLAALLPLPCTVRLLRLARGNQPLQTILGRIRRYNQAYIYVIDHVQRALLGGVWCPGLDAVGTGFLHLDHGVQPWPAQLFQRLGVAFNHCVDIQPLLRDDATPMVAWHCGNRETPAWISLSQFLDDPETQIHAVHFVVPPQPRPRYFIVPFLYRTLRGALIFSVQCIDVDDWVSLRLGNFSTVADSGRSVALCCENRIRDIGHRHLLMLLGQVSSVHAFMRGHHFSCSPFRLSRSLFGSHCG